SPRAGRICWARKSTSRRVQITYTKNSCSGGLGVQGHNLLGDLLHVGNAAESDFHRSDHVIASALESIGYEHDVAGAIGALAMLDAGNIRRRERFDSSIFRAADHHDALISHGVNRFLAREEGPERH